MWNCTCTTYSESLSLNHFLPKNNMLLVLTLVKVNSGIARDAFTQTHTFSQQQTFFMSMYNDFDFRLKNNEQTCLTNATEVTQTRSNSSLVIGVSVDLDKNVWYCSCPNKPNGAWDYIATK